MRKTWRVLTLVAIIPFLASCASPKAAVKGTGEGATEIIEGAGRGTTGFGKGTLGAVKETREATGEFLTGRGDEAIQSGKEAIDAGKEGIKDVLIEPVEGLGKGLRAIDEGIKKATGSEDIK